VSRLPLWLRVAAVVAAFAVLALLRGPVPDVVDALTAGSEEAQFALGVGLWLVLLTGTVVARRAGHWWPAASASLPVLWASPFLGARRAGDGGLEAALADRVPGYFPGWLAGLALYLALVAAWAALYRRTGRLLGVPDAPPPDRRSGR
jgi:hypothetical protein